MQQWAIHHIALRVQNLERCTAFYHQVLGLPIKQRQHDASGHERSVWIGLGHNALLMLERHHGPVQRREGGWHLLALSIEVAERVALQARLQKAGFPTTGETLYTFYVDDPEGNRLGLSHWPMPHAA